MRLKNVIKIIYYRLIFALFFVLLVHLNVNAKTTNSTIHFAVIGDYGDNSWVEEEVAQLIKNQQPDFVLTVGDNNYPRGEAHTLDENVGNHFGEYISINSFFPVLGNHDWKTGSIDGYLSYFNLPGNGRYYDFIKGSVHFFALDSDDHEPDGIESDSKQAQWLQEKISQSSAPFKIVYFHHPPYSSGKHGSSEKLRWPFHEWGIDAVLSGHDHDYERLEVYGVTYIVNGLGGNLRRHPFRHDIPESIVQYNDDHGALFIKADQEQLSFQFLTRGGKVIDNFVIYKKKRPSSLSAAAAQAKE